MPARASLLYLEHGNAGEYDVTRESVAEAVKNITGIAESIEAGLFEPTPSPWRCARCSYDEICDARYGGRRNRPSDL